MNATPKTLALALLAALLTTAPVAADDPPQETAAGPCETFEYSLDPPGYALRPECIPIPLLDNLP